MSRLDNLCGMLTLAGNMAIQGGGGDVAHLLYFLLPTVLKWKLPWHGLVPLTSAILLSKILKLQMMRIPPISALLKKAFLRALAHLQQIMPLKDQKIWLIKSTPPRSKRG